MTDPLHPDGKCSCCGEGRCDFCRRCQAEVERDEAMERVSEVEAQLKAVVKELGKMTLAYEMSEALRVEVKPVNSREPDREWEL